MPAWRSLVRQAVSDASPFLGQAPQLCVKHLLTVSSMDERCTYQGSSSDQGVLSPPVGSLNLLCEVHPSANDQVALAILPADLVMVLLRTARSAIAIYLCAADSRPPHGALPGHAC